MIDATSGQSTVRVANNCSELFLVIASVPEHFSGTQTYGYQAKIVIDLPTFTGQKLMNPAVSIAPVTTREFNGSSSQSFVEGTLPGGIPLRGPMLCK